MKPLDERYQNKHTCCVCEMKFNIPAFPKLLPCMHHICRDCLSKTSKPPYRNDGTDKNYEREVYCGRCKKYIALPPLELDEIPTIYKVMQEILDQTICTQEKCYEKGFAYSYNDNSILCKKHLQQYHQVTNTAFKYEIFINGLYCIKHHQIKSYFCCSCEKPICSQCFRKEHTRDTIMLYFDFLSKYYNKIDFHLPKRVLNLSNKLSKVSMMFDTLYYEQESFINQQIAMNENEIKEKIKQSLMNLNFEEGRHSINPDKLIKELSKEYRIKTRASPLNCQIDVPSIFIPLKQPITMDVTFNDIYGHPGLLDDITIQVIPHNRGFDSGLATFEELTYNVTDRKFHKGGEATIHPSQIAPNKIRLTITGQTIGTIKIRIFIHNIQIENSPICLHIIEAARQVTYPKDKKTAIVSATTLKNGNYVIADQMQYNIRIFNESQSTNIGGFGKGLGQFRCPTRVITAFIDNKEVIIVSDCQNGTLQMFGTDGTFIRTYGKPYQSMNSSPMNGYLSQPISICVSQVKECIYVHDARYKVIQCFPFKGQGKIILKESDIQKDCEITDMDIMETDQGTELVICDKNKHRIIVYNVDKKKYRQKGGENGQLGLNFIYPRSVCVNPELNQVFVLDDRNRIHLLNENLRCMAIYEYHSDEILKMSYSSSLNKLLFCFAKDKEYFLETSLEAMAYFHTSNF